MELLWKWKIFPSHFHQKWAKLTENASKWLEIFAFWHLAQSIQFLSIWKNNQFKNWRFFRPISIKNWRKWLNMVENGRKIVHFDTQLNRFNFSQFEKMTSCKIEDFSDRFQPMSSNEFQVDWRPLAHSIPPPSTCCVQFLWIYEYNYANFQAEPTRSFVD